MLVVALSAAAEVGLDEEAPAEVNAAPAVTEKALGVETPIAVAYVESLEDKNAKAFAAIADKEEGVAFYVTANREVAALVLELCSLTSDKTTEVVFVHVAAKGLCTFGRHVLLKEAVQQDEVVQSELEQRCMHALKLNASESRVKEQAFDVFLQDRSLAEGVTRVNKITRICVAGVGETSEVEGDNQCARGSGSERASLSF